MKNDNFYKTLFLVLLLVIACKSSFAQETNPVKWQYSVNILENNEAELIFTAIIAPGWHLYSQYIDEGGPIPTTFDFVEGTGYSLIGKVVEPKTKVVLDKQFNMNVKYFSEKVEFRQLVKILSDKPLLIEGSIMHMCCDDESCLPPVDVPFSFSMP